MSRFQERMQSLCKHGHLTRQCGECREAAGCGHGRLRSEFCRVCFDREEMKLRAEMLRDLSESEPERQPSRAGSRTEVLIFAATLAFAVLVMLVAAAKLAGA